MAKKRQHFKASAQRNNGTKATTVKKAKKQKQLEIIRVRSRYVKALKARILPMLIMAQED